MAHPSVFAEERRIKQAFSFHDQQAALWGA